MFLLNLVRHWLDDVRRNHALEHGTVAILFGRRGPQRLAGRASGNGFFILGNVDAETLESCARESLRRLKASEASLAVSPMCGTNLAVTGALCAALTMSSLARSDGKNLQQRFGDAVSASTVGALLAQPVGRMVQQHVTTLADHADVEVVGVRQFTPWLSKVYTRRG